MEGPIGEGGRGTVERAAARTAVEGGAPEARAGAGSDGAGSASGRETAGTAEAARADPAALRPEPVLIPPRPGLAWRAALALSAAVVLSLAAVAVPAIRDPLASAAGLALDPAARALSPFGAIVAAGLGAAALGAAIQLLVLDRRRLRRMRERIRWYRGELKRLGPAARPGGRGAAPPPSASPVRLRRRLSAASTERALELLLPLGAAFVPFTLAFVWVEDRFAAEPIGPGGRFTVTASVEPGEPARGAGAAAEGPAAPISFRSARLTASGTLEVLDEPLQRLAPAPAGSEDGPYLASWTVRAVSSGEARLRVTGPEEFLEEAFTITGERGRLRTEARRGAMPGATAGRILGLRIETAPVRVRLPGPAFRLLDRGVRAFTGGRGLDPDRAAPGPALAFIFTAVIAALALQRALGLRGANRRPS